MYTPSATVLHTVICEGYPSGRSGLTDDHAGRRTRFLGGNAERIRVAEGISQHPDSDRFSYADPLNWSLRSTRSARARASANCDGLQERSERPVKTHPSLGASESVNPGCLGRQS